MLECLTSRIGVVQFQPDVSDSVPEFAQQFAVRHVGWNGPDNPLVGRACLLQILLLQRGENRIGSQPAGYDIGVHLIDRFDRQRQILLRLRALKLRLLSLLFGEGICTGTDERADRQRHDKQSRGKRQRPAVAA